MTYMAYIVPSKLLLESPPKDGWHASPIPSDPAQSLVVVQWDNPNWEIEFESIVGVLWLGHPWEPLPVEAVALIASFQPEETNSKGVLDPPVGDTPSPCVATALRNTGWPGARLVR